MRNERASQSEPIPGYRLIELLGSGGFGEVWKCEAPGGLFKAIKFVEGDLKGLEEDGAAARQEWSALQYVKTVRHPFLLSLDRVEVSDGELLIVSELADKSLDDVLREYQAAGRPGIPRGELLAYLREAADALDWMSLRHGLQHLDVKPRNLFLVSNHVKVADFGLVTRLPDQDDGRMSRTPLGGITPLYSSPEVFDGQVSRQSDQYSLAIVYQELLTGSLPFQGKNARQLGLLHLRGEPDLRLLPGRDRAAVARALAKQPALRFPSCQDFVRALEAAVQEGPSAAGAKPAQRAITDAPDAGDAADATGDEADSGVSTTPLVANTMPAPDGTGCASLPGYQFLACLDSNPFLEAWKVRVQEGTEQVLTILRGFDAHEDARMCRLLEQLRTLHHPTLTSVQVVRCERGRLILASDLFELRLRQRWQQCHLQGMPGVSRAELLGYLKAAAAALDAVYREQGLQHLGLNPGNLILSHDRLLIGDFGLFELFGLEAARAGAEVNALYAAPELFDKCRGPSSDQYSLALIYYEMLTGVHPLPSRNRRRAPRSRRGREMALELAPSEERDVLRRALNPDPEKRFGSCTDLIEALTADRSARRTGPVSRPTVVLPSALPLTGVPLRLTQPDAAPLPPGLVVQDWLRRTLNVMLLERARGFRGVLQGGEVLRCSFATKVVSGMVELKLEHLRQQWQAQLETRAKCLIFRVSRPGRLWQRYLGRQPGLELEVRVVPPSVGHVPLTTVSVQVRPQGCGRQQGTELLMDAGVALIQDLRNCLDAVPERRAQERLLLPGSVSVFPATGQLELGEALQCPGKDISTGGIGLVMPSAPVGRYVYVGLSGQPPDGAVALLAEVASIQERPDGGYAVGAAFALPGRE